MGRQRFAASQNTLEELQAMFHAADTDCTGTLDLQEFLIVMGSAGERGYSEKDLISLMANAFSAHRCSPTGYTVIQC